MKEIDVKEFYRNVTIEEINKENIELRVKCNKLLNDNFLLHSKNVQLEDKVKEANEIVSFFKDIFEINVCETLLQIEHPNFKYAISFKCKYDKEQGVFFYTNKIPKFMERLVSKNEQHD